jgi:hypothetical protein
VAKLRRVTRENTSTRTALAMHKPKAIDAAIIVASTSSSTCEGSARAQPCPNAGIRLAEDVNASLAPHSGSDIIPSTPGGGAIGLPTVTISSRLGERTFLGTLGEPVSAYLASHAVEWVDWEDRTPRG